MGHISAILEFDARSHVWVFPTLVPVIVLGRDFCEGPSDGALLGSPWLCLEGRALRGDCVTDVCFCPTWGIQDWK